MNSQSAGAHEKQKHLTFFGNCVIRTGKLRFL